jgi:hypothetical protein
MKIDAAWSQPVPLTKDRKGKLVYNLDLEQLPKSPGVYVFARQHGERVVPIYIGETMSLRSRIKSHLESVPLMHAVRDASSGNRLLIYCTVKTNSEDKAKKQINILERALILHAQTEGHQLVNKRGTKLPTDTICFIGNRTSEAIAPRKMLVKKALTNSRGNGR